jgi:hypothetical protein
MLSNLEISNRLLGGTTKRIKPKKITVKNQTNIDKKMKLQSAHGKALFDAISKRRSKIESDERLRPNRGGCGSGFKQTKQYKSKYNTKYNSITTNNSRPMTTFRKLYAEKYLSIPNTNTGDSILNRLIQNYIEVSPQQKKLDEYTDRIITAQNNEISIPRLEAQPLTQIIPRLAPPPPPPPLAPRLAPPPPPPNQIALSAPQLNQQTIPRPQLDLLSQIQQGKTLKKAKIGDKPKSSSSSPSLQDLLKQQLANRRSAIQSESGGTFHSSNKANTYRALFEARNMYGF